MKKANLYFDTSSLINLTNNNQIPVSQIKKHYDVFLSLLNYFEIIVYKDNSKRINLLEFIKILKKHMPLDLPTSIIRRFLSDFSTNQNQTRWSIMGLNYPDWNDANNVLLIADYLRKEKEYFVVTNTRARTFLQSIKTNNSNPTVQDSVLYLNYIYSQNSILEDIFNGISVIQPNLHFSIQDKIGLMKSLPLICYFAPWLLAHQRLAIKNSHFSPKKNPNSIDIAHSFYMGTCDVFVTDDERLHSLLDDLNKFMLFTSFKKVKIIDSEQFLNSF